MPFLPDANMELPSKASKIWRYVSLAKFLRLVQRGTMYFATAVQLEDRFEGGLTTPSRDRWIRMVSDSHPGISKQMASAAASIMIHTVAVNCWHISKDESYLMWSRYATKEEGGIAIQSTVGRLSKSFATYSGHVWIGKVKYIDYRRDEIEIVRDTKQWFLHKRRPFSSERELRAMILPNLPSRGAEIETARPLGMEVPCDISVLIQSIVVAPTGPPYMLDLVKEICSRFGVSAPVKRSELADAPAAP